MFTISMTPAMMLKLAMNTNIEPRASLSSVGAVQHLTLRGLDVRAARRRRPEQRAHASADGRR